MPENKPIRIGPETAATARKLLARRAELERQSHDEQAEGHAGYLAGLNDALAMLWAGVLEQQT